MQQFTATTAIQLFVTELNAIGLDIVAREMPPVVREAVGAVADAGGGAGTEV